MLSFSQDLDFDENRVKTKVLLETAFSKEIRILLKNGQAMKKHATPYPIMIHVLEGQIELGVQENIYLMKSGDIIALEGGILHDLHAKADTIVRLSLSKSDKIERIQQVINN